MELLGAVLGITALWMVADLASHLAHCLKEIATQLGRIADSMEDK